jgi:hypothetical protein
MPMHNPAVSMDFEKYAKFKPNIEGFLKRIGSKAHYGLQLRGSSQTEVTKAGSATSVAAANVDYDDETGVREPYQPDESSDLDEEMEADRLLAELGDSTS